MKPRKVFTSSLVLVLIVAMLLSACGSTPEPEVVEKVVTQVVPETVVVAGTPEVVEKVVEKEVTKVVEVEVTSVPVAEEVKQLVLVEGVAPEALDPHHSRTASEANLVEMLSDPLVKLDFKTGEVLPELAESWEVADDKLTWTFKLKEGVKFSDGTDFNAEAVKYNFEQMLNPEYGYEFWTQYSVIKEIEVLDDYTVQFKTDVPFAPLLENLTHYTAAFVSPTALEEWGWDEIRLHPVGTGPYQLQSWEGDTVVLERNPYYKGREPWADEIKWLTVPEAGARVAMLESGEADIVARIPPQEVPRLQENPDIRVEINPSLFTISLETNTLKPPLDDPRVRQAMMLAIDHEAIVEVILGNLAAVPESPMGPGVAFRQAFEPWPYDPEQAKALLAEAGYPDGFDINLWTPRGRYLMDAEVAEAVQGYLTAIGINVNFQQWEWSAYVQAFRETAGPEAEKDLWLAGKSSATADHWLHRLWHSEGSSNVFGYSNPEVDQLIDQARQTFDAKERAELYGKVQEILFTEELPFIFLYNQKSVFGVQDNVQGTTILPSEWLILSDAYKE